MIENAFTEGETVIATSDYNRTLTPGKEYKVVKYEPPCPMPDTHFTFPAYVTVIGDTGRPVTGHTHRFRKVST